jgi:hypothetical protein
MVLSHAVRLSGCSYLVSVRKGCFSALAASTFGLACAAYLGTPPRNPSVSLPGRKIPAFRIGNPLFHIRSFRMETSCVRISLSSGIASSRKGPSTGLRHPLPEGKGRFYPSPSGRRCPEGADEGVCHGVQQPDCWMETSYERAGLKPQATLNARWGLDKRG